MKKVILYAMAFMTVLAFTACTKDGVYKPDKKISKIYYSYKEVYRLYDGNGEWETRTDERGKSLSQQWNWDGKKVSSIDYYNGSGSISYTIKFTYDSKQLVRMECEEDGVFLVLSYEGNKLSQLKCYDEDELMYDALVTHDGNKISEIKGKLYDNDKARAEKCSEMVSAAMKVLFPCVDRDWLSSKCLHERSCKRTLTWTEKYSWDGDNISKITVSTNNGRGGSIEYAYDNKKNPYYGFYGADYDDFLEGPYAAFAFVCSKNNVVSEQTTDTNGNIIKKKEYTYKYDGNYPAEKTYLRKYNDSGSEYYTYSFYYEYGE